MPDANIISEREAAFRLGIPRQSLKRMASDRKVPHIRRWGYHFYQWHELEIFVYESGERVEPIGKTCRMPKLSSA